MPYPPPPGPPGSSIFQGIGLNPEQGLPDQTPGDAGDFLETDGSVASWQPVSALPSQTGHGGEFLTTDGVNPSWASASGTTVYDIRTYGAVSASSATDLTTGTVDCSPAFEAAIAAWTQATYTGYISGAFPLGGIYVPPGNWYISRPIVPPSGCVLFGDGQNLSVIVAGGGTDATPSLVQGFGGGVISAQGINPTAQVDNEMGLPNYGAPLVGVTGRSFNITALQTSPSLIIPPSIVLDDCYPWSGWLMWAAGAMDVRFWVNIPTLPPAANRQRIMGSWGVEGEEAFGICATTDIGGTNMRLDATLTTQVSGKVVLTSGNLSLGIHYVELAYDGSNFWFYVDGVHQAHQAMTGRVVKKAWESVTIGERNAVIGGRDLSVIVNGGIDSIELSDIARHTGTGSYTPPTAKHTADSHTLWLANFDQGDPPGLTPQWNPWPFLIAQTRLTSGGFIDAFNNPSTGAFTSTPIVPGLTKHYCRIVGWGQNQMNGYGPTFVRFNNFGVQCSGNASGIVCWSSFLSTFQDILIANPSGLGIYLVDPTSFYSQFFNIDVYNCYGVAVAFASAEIDNIKTIGSGIGFWMPYGFSTNVADQPAWNSFIPLVYGPSTATLQFIHAIGHSEDEETPCYWQKCGAYMSIGAPAIFESCIFDTNLTSFSTPVPPVMINGLSVPMRMTGCNFYPPEGTPAITRPALHGSINADITLENCFQIFSVPFSDIPNLVTLRLPRQVNNQVGISMTDLQANNLAGSFTVLHGYTTGGPTFLIPEPDDNYTVVITCKTFSGSAPAAGSTNVINYVTSTTGFTATLGADPGGTCQIEFTWQMIRTTIDPLYFDYLPMAGTFTNPLVAASPTGTWAVGVTLEPVGQPAFGQIDPPNLESIVGAGTPGAADSWEAYFLHGSRLFFNWGTQVQEQLAFISDDGELHSLLSPGPHNIVFGNGTNIYDEFIGGYQGGTISATFVDGGMDVWAFPPNTFATGTQQTPINIAQRSGATDPLSTGTLRNLKVYTDFNLAISREQDSGPQVGDLEAAIFGDEFSVGVGGTLPSWATQIVNARFGTTYYWMGVSVATQLVNLTDTNPTNLKYSYWSNWGANQAALQAICIQAGTIDLLPAARQASELIPIFTGIAEGGPASVTATPPTLNVQAFCFAFSNTSATTPFSGTVTINGVGFPVTFVTDKATTFTNLASAINASSPTNTLVTAAHFSNGNPDQDICTFTALLPGDAATGISIITDTDLFIYPPSTSGNRGGTMQGGQNAHIIIQGVDFEFPFITDAATTVNTVIGLINASGPTVALVTPTNVSNTLVLTAVTSGAAGNAITVTISPVIGNAGLNNLLGTLAGGYDGAIQKGIPNIVLCTVPPFGDSPLYTGAKETQRNLYNAAVVAYAGAHGGDGVVLANLDTLLRDPGDHTKLDPAYLLSPGTYLVNDAGQTAIFGLLDPLLP